MAKETDASLRQEMKKALAPSRMNPSHGYSKYALGFAKVVEVNDKEEFIALRIITGQQDEYQRSPIPVSYPGSGKRQHVGVVPSVGDIAIVGYTNQESAGGTPTPVIVGWASTSPWMGYDWNPSQEFSPEEYDFNTKNSMALEGIFQRTRHKKRPLDSGNAYISSAQGSDILCDESVLITNRRGNEIVLRDQDQNTIFRSVAEHHALAGARIYSGPVQRDARLLTPQMINLGTIWDGPQQLDETDTPLSENDLPYTPVEEIGQLTPADVFRRSPGKTSPISGLNFGSNVDPYEILKRGLLIDDEGQVLDIERSVSDAIYGGKSIYRVSVDSGKDGFPLNAELGTTQAGRALSEMRFELNHTTDGQLPVTEQTDGFDAERLPVTQGDIADSLGMNRPFIEWVMGSVVGNDAYGKEGSQDYGMPLKATIIDASGRVAPGIGSAIGSPIGEHLATLFKMSPPFSGGGTPTFWGTQKDGRVKVSIGGNAQAPWSVELTAQSGILLDSKKHVRVKAQEGFSVRSSRGREEDNLGVDLYTENGAIRLYAGGKSAIGRLGRQSAGVGGGDADSPSILIEAKSNVTIKAGRKLKLSAQNFDFGNSAQSRLSATSAVSIESGDKIRMTAKTLDVTILGKTVETYSGPKDFLPTNLPIRTEQFIANPLTGHVGGPTDEYRMLLGDRIETILAGNHLTTILVGTATYQVGGGIWSAGAGINRVAIDSATGINNVAGIGNITLTAAAGAIAATSSIAIRLFTSGIANVSGVAGVALGGPGKIGGIVCSSDLDPLTGLPLATFLMGSPGHTLVLPV